MEDRVVIITGGGTGIGRAAVIEQIKKEEAERVPLGRRGTSDEIAAWMASLANPAASWITDQVIAIDGGLSIA